MLILGAVVALSPAASAKEGDACPKRLCFEKCDLPSGAGEQPSAAFASKLKTISSTGHHVDVRLGSGMLERKKWLDVMNAGGFSRDGATAAWQLNDKYHGPCSGLLAVFWSKVIEDRETENVAELWELRYGTEDEARRVAKLLVSAWDWNYHPFAVKHAGSSVIVVEGRHEAPEPLEKLAAHFGAGARSAERGRGPGLCAAGAGLKPLHESAGDAKHGSLTVYVAGMSPRGRLAWLERHDGGAEWWLHVVDLVNDRVLTRQQLTGRFQDLRSVCTQHATDILSILGEYSIDSGVSPALEQPSPNREPSAIDVRATDQDFEVWLRGRPGAKKLGSVRNARPDSASVPRALGLLRSPFEQRIAVPVLVQETGPDGVTSPAIQFFGGRLDKNWGSLVAR